MDPFESTAHRAGREFNLAVERILQAMVQREYQPGHLEHVGDGLDRVTSVLGEDGRLWGRVFWKQTGDYKWVLMVEFDPELGDVSVRFSNGPH